MALALVLNRGRRVPAEDSPAFGAIAERFRRAGDLDRAVSLCQEGLQKFPNHLSSRVTLGWALLDLGRYDEARVELEQVLKRAPDNLAAIRGLAELHDRTEHDDVASMQSAPRWHVPEPPVPVPHVAEDPLETLTLAPTAGPWEPIKLDDQAFPSLVPAPFVDAPPAQAVSFVADEPAIVAPFHADTAHIADEAEPLSDWVVRFESATTPAEPPAVPEVRPALLSVPALEHHPAANQTMVLELQAAQALEDFEHLEPAAISPVEESHEFIRFDDRPTVPVARITENHGRTEAPAPPAPIAAQADADIDLLDEGPGPWPPVFPDADLPARQSASALFAAHDPEPGDGLGVWPPVVQRAAVKCTPVEDRAGQSGVTQAAAVSVKAPKPRLLRALDRFRRRVDSRRGAVLSEYVAG